VASYKDVCGVKHFSCFQVWHSVVCILDSRPAILNATGLLPSFIYTHFYIWQRKKYPSQKSMHIQTFKARICLYPQTFQSHGIPGLGNLNKPQAA